MENITKKEKKHYLKECREKLRKRESSDIEKVMDKLGALRFSGYWCPVEKSFFGFGTQLRLWHPAVWLLVFVAVLSIFLVAVRYAALELNENLSEIPRAFKCLREKRKDNEHWLN